MLKIKYKVLEYAKDLPLINYQTDGSSGMDLYSANISNITLEPLDRMSIPTGICMSIPLGYEAQIRPRSGLFIKNGINANFGTIDSDYRGEIKVILFNHGKDEFLINNKDRIAQMVLVPVIKMELEETDNLPNTVRGEGGFGSTGK